MKRSSKDCRLWFAGLAAMSLAGVLAGTAVAGQTVEGVDWVRSGADFSAYDKVLLKQLDLSDIKLLKPVWAQDDTSEWTFQPGTGEAVQAMFQEEMSAAIGGEGGFPLVDAAGPGVLQIEIEILSITPYIKPGSDASEDGYTISTLGSGDVVVSAEIRDAETGSLLALVEGERTIGTEYKEVSQDAHIANLRGTFKQWGSRIRDVLTLAHRPTD